MFVLADTGVDSTLAAAAARYAAVRDYEPSPAPSTDVVVVGAAMVESVVIDGMSVEGASPEVGPALANAAPADTTASNMVALGVATGETV